MISIFIALFLTGIGVLSLYTSWGKSSHHNYLTFFSWVQLLLALYVWCIARGVEFGPVYWFVSIGFFAFVLIHIKATQKISSELFRPRASLFISWRVLSEFLMKCLLAGPLAGLASICLALFLVVYIPTDNATQLVIAGIILPLLWSLACYWVCATQKHLQVACSFITVIAVSSFNF